MDLKRYYYWSGMKKDVATFATCLMVKNEHQVPSGLLHNLPLPEWKWKMITMDFVTVSDHLERKECHMGDRG